MKKVFALILTVALLSLAVLSVSAAGTLGANEQKIMDFLTAGGTVTIDGKDVDIHIPAAYLNQAKNYFASTTGDIDAADYDAIMKELEAGKKTVETAVEADPAVVAKGEIQLEKLPLATKTEILDSAKTAAAAADLTLEYTGEDVVIKDAAGSVKFEDEAVIKTTGANVNTVAMVAVFAGFVAMIAAAAVTAKKAELF